MKKIIFDLDNTLLFIGNDWKNYYQKFINNNKLNITPEDLYQCIDNFEIRTKNIIVTKKMFCDFINRELSIELTRDALDNYLEEYASIPLLKVDIVYDLLQYLSSKYELIGYSNWFSDNQRKRLQKYQLDKFFIKIYGWDDVPLKPSMKALESIMGKNNILDYIFIGDSIEVDLEIPRSMGMKTIFYNRKRINQNKYMEVLEIEKLKKIL